MQKVIKIIGYVVKISKWILDVGRAFPFSEEIREECKQQTKDLDQNTTE